MYNIVFSDGGGEEVVGKDLNSIGDECVVVMSFAMKDIVQYEK